MNRDFRDKILEVALDLPRPPVHLLPKIIRHTIYLSYINGRRRVAQVTTKRDGVFLATVEQVSIDLVVLNLDVEHPDSRPRAHRCIRISDIEDIAVQPIKSNTLENVK